MSAQGPPYRIGIVGAGNMSTVHIAGIERHPDRMKVTALCDPNPEALQERAETLGISDSFTHLQDFIRSKSADVAVVCTPTHVRSEVVLPLLEAGIPVLCEKPFAETYAEARRIAQKAQECGVPLAINQNLRRCFTFHIGRRILASGHLGKPLHLVQAVNSMRHDTGWRLGRKRYLMSVMSIHWFDGYRYLLDDEPETVYARGVNSPATEGGDDTAVSVILQFRKGTVVSLSESFSSFTGHTCATLDCQHGGLIMGYDDLTEIRPAGETVKHDNPFDKPEATAFLLDDLLHAIEEERQPHTSAEDNLKSMRILEGAYRSLQQCRAIRTDEVE